MLYTTVLFLTRSNAISVLRSPVLTRSNAISVSRSPGAWNRVKAGAVSVPKNKVVNTPSEEVRRLEKNKTGSDPVKLPVYEHRPVAVVSGKAGDGNVAMTERESLLLFLLIF